MVKIGVNLRKIIYSKVKTGLPFFGPLRIYAAARLITGKHKCDRIVSTTRNDLFSPPKRAASSKHSLLPVDLDLSV